jgi:hypothetical protein
MNTGTHVTVQNVTATKVAIEWVTVYERLKDNICKTLAKEYDIKEQMISCDIINPLQVRNVVIRSRYWEGRLDGHSAIDLLEDLSNEYGLSIDSISSIVKGKR